MRFSAQSRLKLISSVLKEGKTVAQTCREAGISRKTFYKWYKRYQETKEFNLEVFKDREWRIEKHPRRVPEEIERRILSLVIKEPQLSSHELARIVRIGNHGIQRVLERAGLSRYEMRLAYSQSQRMAPQIAPADFLDRVKLVWETFIPALAPVPPPERRKRVLIILKAFGASGLVSFVFAYGLISWVRLLGAQTPAQAIGLIFATLALFMGSIFFLYSLKYYISLAIVLSFSQQEASSGERLASSRKRGILSWILGMASGGIQGSEWEKRVTGLEPNLEHIKLERYPKISVHVPLYNEKNVVERLLSSVTSFDYPSTRSARSGQVQGGYEVIIADDSTDETTKIAKQFLQGLQGELREIKGNEGTEIWKFIPDNPNQPSLTLIHRASRSGFKGGALREALKHTDPNVEFITVFDADFVPYPDTLELFLKYFQATAGSLDFARHTLMKANVKPIDANERISSLAPDSLKSEGPISSDSRIAAVQGYQWPLDSARGKHVESGSNIAAVQGYQWHVLNKSENWITRAVRSEYAGSYVIERSGAEIYTGLKQISGAVYMIRRDVLEEIGWETSITEDFQLTLKLYEKGYKVVYTPYIQAPAECVSTLKRLIRQRMRWAEGHSNNIRRMFIRLFFGRWTDSNVVNPKSQILNPKQYLNSNDTNSKRFEHLDLKNSNLFRASDLDISASSKKKWIPSPLTLSEKLEFLYLSPYYLQAFFFLLGTISWLISETVFAARLPFWTSLWGWSLVLTNFLSLPLMNAVGLFLEESEEKDYLGLTSFAILSYVLVPFQAYASLKGFVEKQEGPWFRTPKTGRITDIITRGRFYRFISGILPGRASPAIARIQANSASGLKLMEANERILAHSRKFASNSLLFANSPYLGLATANSRFDSFKIKPKGYRFIGNLVLVVALTFSLSLSYLGANVKTGSLADLPIQTRVEKTGEDSSFTASLFGVFSPQEVMAATEKAQDIVVSGVRQISPETLIASSALALLLTLALLIHFYKKKRRFFKKAVKFIFVFSLIFSWLLSGWPQIWQNPRIPPEVQEAEAAAFANGYTYRRLIDITDAQVSSGPHTNFPILVSSTIADLKTTANGGDVTDAQGDDIIFTDSDGTTQLAHEVEKYTATTGELVAWVRVPSLAATSTLYIYYGNSSVTTFQGNVTSNGVTGVWDANFKGAWHLKEDPSGTAPQMTDSTVNASHGTSAGAMTSSDQVAGKVNGGLDFDGLNDYVTMGTNPPIAGLDKLTLSAWMYRSAAADSVSVGRYIVGTRVGLAWWSDGNVYFISDEGYDRFSDSYTGWHYYVVGYDGTEPLTADRIIGYRDGVLVDASLFGVAPTTIPAYGSDEFRLGIMNSNVYSKGIVDEVRISNVVRSAGWITTEYNSQSSPSGFYAVGAETTNPAFTQSAYRWFNNVDSTDVGTALTNFSNGYNFRRLIDITDAQVSSGPHTNFPILVSSTIADLKTTANGGDVTDAQGDDIIFTDSDGTTQLAHEVEKYTATTGELIAWVRIPSLAATSTLYIYYGNSSVTTFQGNVTSNGVTGVWDANYKGAWHLKEDPSGTAPQMKDSTSNANDGTSNGVMTTSDQVAGQVDGSLDFDGTNDRIDLGTAASLAVTTNHTFSAWVKIPATTVRQAIIGRSTDTHFMIEDTSSRLRGFAKRSDGVSAETFHCTAGTAIDDNTWRYVVMTYDTTIWRAYVNGNQDCTGTGITGTLASTAGASNYIAFYLGDFSYGLGLIDEVRVSNSVRSAGWITTEYNNQNSPAGFYSIGAETVKQDTAATLGSAGVAFRLRMLLHVADQQLDASGQNFKLQFAQQSGTCDTGFVGETYADVTAATVVAYKDNTTPADGATLTANANDPTHGADTIVNQTYEELNNFTNSVAAIPAGQDGKWDFAMVDNSAPQNTTYCLRVLKSDGTVLDTYTVIPEFTTVPENPILLFGLYPLLAGLLKRFRKKGIGNRV